MRFLKKHYEKIILCVVLLGLAAAAVWMGSAMKNNSDDAPAVPTKGKSLVALDMAGDMALLAQMTNPPPVNFTGEHLLFNPVTWRRKANGEMLKILKTGPAALTLSHINPLYTIISYDHPSGSGPVYVMNVQTHSGRKSTEYSKKDEKKKHGLYIIRGIKGADDTRPEALILEIPETLERVTVTTNQPYQRVDGYTVDMYYTPESRSLTKMKLDDTFNLDGQPFKIVEITNNLIRVEDISSTHKTTVRLNATP